MGIFDIMRVFGDSEDEMAKKSVQRKLAQPPSASVAEFSARLARSGTDKAAFERALAELKDATSVSAADIIAIAHAYCGGGKKPASKAAAYAAISKRFVEIVRFHAKNRLAEKARPW